MFALAHAGAGLFALVLRAVADTPLPSSATPVSSACPVTIPNGNPPPGQPPVATFHGNGALWVALHQDGRIPVAPDNIDRSGRLGIKLPWWRGVPGQLSIATRRLDGASPPASTSIPGGYGETGFQATGVVFPEAGCWEITGRVGSTSLTFVAIIEPATAADLALPTPDATPERA